MITIFAILTLLFIKHMVFDFMLQPPFMYLNKGTYGHWGGITHATVHASATLLILAMFVSPLAAGVVALIEFIIHYHMDWFKMWWGKKNGYTPTTSEKWFFWLGFDQTVHSLTYVGIAAWFASTL